jgi:transposase-like protein
MKKQIIKSVKCKGVVIPLDICKQCEYHINNKNSYVVCGKDLTCPKCKFKALDIHSLKVHYKKCA